MRQIVVGAEASNLKDNEVDITRSHCQKVPSYAQRVRAMCVTMYKSVGRSARSSRSGAAPCARPSCATDTRPPRTVALMSPPETLGRSVGAALGP